MNKRTRTRPTDTAAAAPSSATRDEAVQAFGSNAQLQAQLAAQQDQDAGTAVLDQVEAEQGERLKLNGYSEFRKFVPNDPDWAVKPGEHHGWFEDGLEVVGVRALDPEAALEEAPGGASLGEVVLGSLSYSGQLGPLRKGMKSGRYTFDGICNPENQYLRFDIDYRAARPREGILDLYEDAEGNKSLQWWLVKFTQVSSDGIDALTGARSAFEALGGRDLDVFGQDFGEELEPIERLMKGTEFVANVVTKGSGKYAKADLMFDGGSFLAEETAKLGEDLGVLDGKAVHATSAVISLLTLFNSAKGVEGTWSFFDYIEVLGEAQTLSDEVVQATFGEAFYEHHWQNENVQHALTVLRAVGSIKGAGSPSGPKLKR